MARAKKPSGNRTDLLTAGQPVSAPTGLPYGEHQQLTQSQQQVPLAAPQQMPPDVAAQQAAQQAPPPTQPIHAPTARPNEPLTAGMQDPATMGDPTLAMLRGVYARYPSADILGLINEAKARGQM